MFAHAHWVQVLAIHAMTLRAYLTNGRCARVLHESLARPSQVGIGREEQAGLREVFPVNWRTNVCAAEGITWTIRRVPLLNWAL